MMRSKAIEHGGYPDHLTRTISRQRRDADLYAGITKRAKRAAKTLEHDSQIIVDKINAPEVSSFQSPTTALQTRSNREMTLTFKSLSKNGKAAMYSGAVTPIRLSLAAFPDKQYPQEIVIADGVFAGPKVAKVKLTKEERAAQRAAAPRPTEAERIAQAEARLEKRKAKLVASGQEASL